MTNLPILMRREVRGAFDRLDMAFRALDDQNKSKESAAKAGAA